MKTYLIRLVTPYDLDKMDMLEIEARLRPFQVRKAEIFNEEDFVKKVWDKSGLNEIDIDVLFQDILHIPEEEVEHYIFPKEDVY